MAWYRRLMGSLSNLMKLIVLFGLLPERSSVPCAISTVARALTAAGSSDAMVRADPAMVLKRARTADSSAAELVME